MFSSSFSHLENVGIFPLLFPILSLRSTRDFISHTLYDESLNWISESFQNVQFETFNVLGILY